MLLWCNHEKRGKYTHMTYDVKSDLATCANGVAVGNMYWRNKQTYEIHMGLHDNNTAL